MPPGPNPMGRGSTRPSRLNPKLLGWEQAMHSPQGPISVWWQKGGQEPPRNQSQEEGAVPGPRVCSQCSGQGGGDSGPQGPNLALRA